MFHFSPPSTFHTGFPIAPQAEYVYPAPFDSHYPSRGIEFSCRHVNPHSRHPEYAVNAPYYPPIAFDVDAALEEYAIAQRREQLIRQEKLRRIRAAQEYRQRRLEEQRRAKAIAELVLAAQQEAIIKEQNRRAQAYEAYQNAQIEAVARSQQLAFRAQREAEWRQCAQAKQAFLDALRSRDHERGHQSGPCVKSRTTAGPKVATPQEALRRRLSEDDDVDMQEVIANVLKLMSTGAIHDGAQKKPAEPAAKSDKGKARESPNIVFPWEMLDDLQLKQDRSGEPTRKVHFDKPVSTPAVSVKKPKSSTDAPVKVEGAEAQPETVISQENDTKLSLGAIDRIDNLLQQLQSSFVFPSELDPPSRSSTPSPVSDADSAQLPFTSKNKPVHVYEHSLNGLLARLDEVDSHGDEEVRRRRKEVVMAVEKALEDIDRKVTEASPVIEKQTLAEEAEDQSLPVEVAVTEAHVVAEEAVVAEDKVVTQEEVVLEVEVAHETPILDTVSSSLPVILESQAPANENAKAGQSSEAAVVIEESLEAVPVVAELEDSHPASDTAVSDSPVYEEVEVEEVSVHEVSPVTEIVSESEVLAASAEADVPATSVEEDSFVVEEVQVIDAFTPTPNVEVEAVEAPADSDSVPPTILSATLETSETVPTTLSSENVEQPTTTDESASAPSDTETSFLLQSHQEDDQSYIRAKSRVAESKDESENGWEEAELSGSDVDVDGETWSEVE